MNERKARKISLRLLIFVIVPLFAFVFFWIRWRINDADYQTRVLKQLYEQDLIEYEGRQLGSDEDWWDCCLWCENLLGRVRTARISAAAECKELAVLPRLECLVIWDQDETLSLSSLRELAIHRHVTELACMDCRFDRQQWAALCELKNLNTLSLHQCEIDAAGMECFAELPIELLVVADRSLAIGHATGGDYKPLPDAALRSIGKMSRLAELTLDSTPVSDEALRHLAGLNKLRLLQLLQSKINGEGLEALRQLPQLRSLDLSVAQLKPVAFEHLAGMKHLRILLLDHTNITDQDLKPLSKLTQLQDLSLNETAVTDEGLKHLLPMRELATLGIAGTRVGDEGIEFLKQFGRLQWLDIHRTYASPETANALGDHLYSVQPYGFFRVGWQGAALIDTTSGEVAGYAPSMNEVSNRTGLYVVNALTNAMQRPQTRAAQSYSLNYWYSESSTHPQLALFPLQRGEPIERIALDSFAALQPELKLAILDQERAVLRDFRGNVNVMSRKKNEELPKEDRMRAQFVRSQQGIIYVFDNHSFIAVDSASKKILWSSKTNRLQRLTAENCRLWKNRLLAWDSGRVEVFDLSDGSLLVSRPVIGNQPLSVGIDGDDRVFTLHKNVITNQLEVHDLATGSLQSSTPGISHALLSADARLVVMANVDGVTIWEAASGRKVAFVDVEVRIQRQPIMRFTPDGRYLIVNLGQRAIKARYR